MPAAYRADVFEPFFTTVRGRGGTGLGLRIVRALVAGAGGRVILLPDPGGTAFRVDLPQA
ncbi:MAG: ATP-binding protein [Janthinobacterium lividum]